MNSIGRTILIISCLLGSNALMIGCSTSSTSPYADHRQQPRDPTRARELHRQASAIWLEQPAEAERLLREALVADLYHGPSHNNLGVLLMDQDRLYEAANELEWARKLMPGHPDPRVNLAMVLERAGRTDEAFEAYDSALAVYDNYLPALQGRTRLKILSGEIDAQTEEALKEIALRGDPQWQEWARMQILTNAVNY